MSQNFRQTHSFDERLKCSTQLRTKYPTRIPILLDRGHKTDRSIPELRSFKFLVPADTQMGLFVHEVRKYTTLQSNQSLYLLINNTLPPYNQSIGDLYVKHRDADGFLYITYNGDNVFG
jgi:GABA(A) receptor-associated protein